MATRKKKSVKKGKGKKRSKKIKKPVESRFITHYAFAVLALATFLAFFPVLQADFVDFDDQKLILEKLPAIDNYDIGYMLSTNLYTPHYKPMVYATWFMEYKLFGLGPFHFHLFNLLYHIANVILVYLVLRRLVPLFRLTQKHGSILAFFGALLFSLHPMHVESVAWAVERKDVLYSFFYLLSIFWYTNYLRSGKLKWTGLSALGFLLALTCKAPAITLPFVLLAIDYAYNRKWDLNIIKDKLAHGIVFILGLTLFGAFSSKTTATEIAGYSANIKGSVYTAAANLVDLPVIYQKIVVSGMKTVLWFVHLILPFKLSVSYPREEIIGFFGHSIHLFPVLLIGVGAFLLYKNKDYRLLLFCAAFFMICLGPAIIRTGSGKGIFLSDRYTYMACFGFVFLLAATIMHLIKNSQISRGILAAIAIAYGIGTFNMSKVWKNSEALWTNSINKFPQSAYPYASRGAFYRDQKDFEKALLDLNKAISISPDFQSYSDRGVVYRRLKKYQEAMADFDESLRLRPGYTKATVNKGNVYLDLGQYDQAIKLYTSILDKKGWYLEALVNRGAAYGASKQYDKALVDLNKAETLSPSFYNLYQNRAYLFYELQQYEKSIADYQRLLQFTPDDHLTMNDIGIIYGKLGRHQEAIDYFSRAIRIAPGVAAYYGNRARAYTSVGNNAAAQKDNETMASLKR